MKRIIFGLAICLLSMGVQALELSQEALQGRWLIVKMGDMDTKELGLGEDIWEFKGNQWTVVSSGVRMKPETFSINGNEIDFGSYSIKVTDLSGGKMVAESMGVVQVLEKMK
jgi:hypothetical protein